MPVINAHPDPCDSRGTESCLADLEHARMVENIACHRKILAAMELWEHRMITAADAGADAILAGNDTFSEISARLRCSHTTARGYVEAAALLLRMPILADSVARGDIDYANLRMIGTVLGDDASMATLSMLDEAVARAAMEFTPSALRAQLWKMWLTADPDEAGETRRRRASTDRRAYIRRGGHGLSWLTACLTDVEGSQADALLSEVTATVCSNDPRSKGALRADGLMALLHGEADLVCGCGDSDCPKGAHTAPSRRKPLIEVVVDAETLLGLADNPATLPDGTPIDPELARTLAQDATWQAIITDTRRVTAQGAPMRDGNQPEIASDTPPSGVSGAPWAPADTCSTAAAAGAAFPSQPEPRTLRPGTEKVCATAGIDDFTRMPIELGLVDLDDIGEPAPAKTHSNTRDSVLAVALADIESRFSADDSGAPAPPDIPAERYLLARGRIQRSGTALAHACGRTRYRDAQTLTGAADLIDAWTNAVAVCPDLSGHTGHGGLTDPPPAALTYRPSADVAALVRAQHPTCAFPDCTIVSRRCELDHIVAFDHDDPIRGGWTIPANLQPLCKRHHDIKSHRYWTCTPLPGGASHWRHHSGIERIVVPCNGFAVAASAQPQPVADRVPSFSDTLTDEESLDLLYEPTWWERHMAPRDHPGNDPELITHYREHQAIVHRRTALQPAPF